MIVLEFIVPCRWPLVALACASPETMWLRAESAYIFHHKYPIPEYSMINGNHEGHSSREAPKSENNAAKLTALLFIVHNDKGFPRLWLIKCYHWCKLILCRMIAYGWEFIQSGFPRSKSMTGIVRCHACVIILVILFIILAQGGFLGSWVNIFPPGGTVVIISITWNVFKAITLLVKFFSYTVNGVCHRQNTLWP